MTVSMNGWRRTLLAFLAACGLTAGVLSITTQPALAEYHHCEKIGTADIYGNYAAQCVDLYFNGYNVYGGNDISCWAPGKTPLLVECAGIHEQPGTCTDLGGPCQYAPQGICGAYYGHSPCGLRRVRNYAPDMVMLCGGEYWGITIGTSVRLPQSGKTVSGGLVGLHHYEWNAWC